MCYVLCAILSLLLSFQVEARLKKPSPPPFDVQHYKIDITLNEKDLSYEAKVSIQVKSLIDNLKQVNLHFQKGMKTFSLPIVLKQGEEVTITTTAQGKADEREQDGLFVTRPDPNGAPQFFTQFETQGARKVFPCFDEPFDKATTEVVLTANAKYTLLSNGKKVSEKILTDGRRQVHFVNKDPISTYHITLVAAELTPLQDSTTSISGKKIPLSIYARSGKTQDAAYAMSVLKKALRFYENYFGIPYPWDSYGIVALPGFMWGGMENKGLANLNEARLLWNETHPYAKKLWITGLVAHELAHEWFGNMVTMTWWDDLWLNEAFATFANTLFEAKMFGDDFSSFYNYQWLARSYFPQDRGPLSHPILPKQVDTLDELFDGITYAKGIQVVQMLEDFIGKDHFRAGVQSYFAKHPFGNATTGDFLQAMEGSSGRSLNSFAKSWLHLKGYPHLTLAWIEKGLKTTQEGGPFVFKLPVGSQTLTIDKKTEVFPFSKEEHGKMLAVNAGGKALVDYRWEGLVWPAALNDADPFVRFYTTDRVIGTQKFSEELRRILIDRLRDKNKMVASGVSWSLIDNRLDPAFAKEVARAVWKEAQMLYETLSKTEPRQADIARNLLTLLGQADLPALYPFLQTKAVSGNVDEKLGALAGLLRSGAKNRYAVFETVLKQNRHRHDLKLDLLITLALTPKGEVLPKLNRYLSDTRWVAKDDSTIPTRVWRTIYSENKGVVYSKEGVEEVVRFVKANWDRPGVAEQALETLEEIGTASKEVKKEAAGQLEALLKNNPPDLIASVGRKILTAAK